MISEPVLYGIGGLAYVLALVVLVAWLRRIPDEYNRYCYPVVVIIAASAVGAFTEFVQIGTYTVGSGELSVGTFIADMLAYPGLWAVSAMLAGVSRRLFAVVVGVPFAQRAAFEVANLTGGTLALVCALAVILGHVFMGYLIVTRVWESAQDVSVEQRLLHWKSRNLLLFIIGMIILYAVLLLFGVYDAFVGTVLTQYTNVMLRVGFAGFLFTNLDAIDTDAAPDGLLPTQDAQSSGQSGASAYGDD
jgi:sensory rhodopsin